jgi:hypothetical protein
VALEVNSKNSTSTAIFLWLITKEEAFIGFAIKREPMMSRKIQDRQTKSNEDALAAFVQKKAEIDTMLARLQALSDDHFGYSPDEITWSHAEGLAHYAELLKRITDQAFNEGEHAE